MNTQINLRLPEKLLISAKSYSEEHGFSSIQELIKEAIREKLFEGDKKINTSMENIGWLKLAEKNMLKLWENKKDEETWGKYL